MLGHPVSGVGDDSVDTRFDASQYAFFGKDVVEEVELGGLEDDEDDEANYQFSDFGEKEELNKVVSEPRSTSISDRSFSREGSSAADWAREPGFSNWVDQHISDAEDAQDNHQRWPEPHPLESYPAGFKSTFRTSSDNLQQQHIFSKSPVVPKSSFITDVPLSNGIFQASPDYSHHPNISPPTSGPHVPFYASNFSPFSGSEVHMPGPRGMHHNGSGDQFYPRDLSSSRQQQNHPLNHAGLQQSDNWQHQQQQQDSNGLPPRLPSQQQQHRFPPFQPSLANFQHFQSQLQRPYSSPPHMMNKLEGMSLEDQRWRPTLNGRHNFRPPQQFSDTWNQNYGNVWPEFQAKYMSAEEIDNILRIHHAATHSNDPYTEDYYHQACVAKRSGSSRLKPKFCPRSLRDVSSHQRINNEPHAYLQIDALGRIPFSSLRRPRPLLEVDPPSVFDDKTLDENSLVKPLEQEPLLAARIIIEDGICLLLDVDDIDRLYTYSQPQEGGNQLKQRRQMLLEGLASSLQLVDPLVSGEIGYSVELEPKDDLVFRRLVSLPKGRKLLSRYLQLLFPGSELARMVCMAIFRHLRYLFGSIPSNLDEAKTTHRLSSTVSSCVGGMNLSALSACLAAIVCSPEQPPLRPLGSSAGDWASVVIKSVLDRVTELFTDRNSASNYSMATRALWQASFDSFFGLLTRYCLSKYDSIMQSLLMQKQNIEAGIAISREIPVELLRASLPHTDEQQRKLLLEFAQRSLPASGNSAHRTGSVSVATESIPS